MHRTHDGARYTRFIHGLKRQYTADIFFFSFQERLAQKTGSKFSSVMLSGFAE
jgi:hypothetical protein